MHRKDLIISKLTDELMKISIIGDHITVAELKTVKEDGINQTIDINTALISPNLIKRIRSSHVNPYVVNSSAYYEQEYEYKPKFSLFLSKSSGLKNAESLVVSWCSGNHTTLAIDQGFLSSFELSPRLVNDTILWDDLKQPEYDVVQNKLLSENKDRNYSDAYVNIKIDYLKAYLSMRKKSAVNVFTLKKQIPINEDISFLLQEKKSYVEEFERFEVRISRCFSNDNLANLEINGFKVLFENDNYNVEEEKQEGHHWKGIEGLVTEWRARYEMPFEYIYVSDSVLSIYEVDDDYDVYPLSGSVSYRNQWSVSHCDRVGKNAIKIELKKLYEGNNFEIINYWNRFSIYPSEIIEGENIALLSERLVRKFFRLGRLLASFSNYILDSSYTSQDIIGLDEEYIEYTGWSDFTEFKSIAQHINLKSFPKESFISRCKKLYILLGENLKEKPLRNIINALDFPIEETKNLRSIKLLELIASYLEMADHSGLDIIQNKDILSKRVLENKAFAGLSQLYALNSIRQLDAHKTKDSKSKLNDAFISLGIHPNAVSNNYADASWQVYHSLDQMLDELNALISKII